MDLVMLLIGMAGLCSGVYLMFGLPSTLIVSGGMFILLSIIYAKIKANN